MWWPKEMCNALFVQKNHQQHSYRFCYCWFCCCCTFDSRMHSTICTGVDGLYNLGFDGTVIAPAPPCFVCICANAPYRSVEEASKKKRKWMHPNEGTRVSVHPWVLFSVSPFWVCVLILALVCFGESVCLHARFCRRGLFVWRGSSVYLCLYVFIYVFIFVSVWLVDGRASTGGDQRRVAYVSATLQRNASPTTVSSRSSGKDLGSTFQAQILKSVTWQKRSCCMMPFHEPQPPIKRAKATSELSAAVGSYRQLHQPATLAAHSRQSFENLKSTLPLTTPFFWQQSRWMIFWRPPQVRPVNRPRQDRWPARPSIAACRSTTHSTKAFCNWRKCSISKTNSCTD